jgi:dihydroneopterin aldolase/2-amino-4-hydroxy-6-hydroxymethyldihydropteridine diphosphokinase/dihydropteroate synthase
MSSLGVNYSSVSKAIYASLSDRAKTLTKPEEVLEVCAGIVMQLECVDSVTITVTLPRALLRAMEVRYSATYTSEGEVKGRVCEIKELRVECVVGLHPHERRERQRLEIGLKVDGVGEEWDHKALQDLAVSVSSSALSSRKLHREES